MQVKRVQKRGCKEIIPPRVLAPSLRYFVGIYADRSFIYTPTLLSVVPLDVGVLKNISMHPPLVLSIPCIVPFSRRRMETGWRGMYSKAFLRRVKGRDKT